MTYLWHCSKPDFAPFCAKSEAFKSTAQKCTHGQTIDTCTSGLNVVRYCSVGIIGEHRVRKYTSQCIHQQFGTLGFRIGSITSSRLIGDQTDIMGCSQHYQFLWVVTATDSRPINWPTALNSMHKTTTIHQTKEPIYLLRIKR